METLTLTRNNGGSLPMPMVNKTLCIDIDSIVRIEASSNYSKIYCKGQALPIVVAKVLRWFEERLPQHSFARVHRTHLVNKKYMVGIRNDKVILETGTQIGISRRKRKTCLDKLS
ncbi:MAG: LytTR family transcriptional regulator [Bacteroidetes bacterium]|jgi:two-component system LytT family response regulator|nr:MAG: LytTR family transcriptional regulator [Bacteroidota bacterium]